MTAGLTLEAFVDNKHGKIIKALVRCRCGKGMVVDVWRALSGILPEVCTKCVPYKRTIKRKKYKSRDGRPDDWLFW